MPAPAGGALPMTLANTVVFQSYRTHAVPGWITHCMASVKQWAIDHGHDYCFVGDDFLQLAPDWYRAKAGGEICPVTDLCRLLLARQLLGRGHQRAIWIDADMLVFRPEGLQLPLREGFAFTHEVWIEADRSGQVAPSHRVNNSIALFARDNPQLDFFIDACLRIASAREKLSKLDVGTSFLSSLRGILPFPLVEGVATLSPMLMRDIASGETSRLAMLAHAHAQPLVCANLCASLERWNGGSDGAAVYDSVVERLLGSHGDVLNRFRDDATTPA